MQGIYSVLLLIVSNIFMTFAWYGHLKLQTHIELASFRCDTALMGYCPIRVLFPSTGQPHRISRKRRTFHSCTAQSHTRSYHTYGIRRFFGGRIPKRDPSLESSRRSGLLGSGSLFRIHEIKILTQYLRF